MVFSLLQLMHVVFESSAAATGKKPEPDWTEPQKTEPPDAIMSGFKPVAVAVFRNLNYLKPHATIQNRLQPTTVTYLL